MQNFESWIISHSSAKRLYSTFALRHVIYIMSPDLFHWLIAISLGYLAGSIPFGLLLARAFGQGDIRTIGSGNIGATKQL